MPQVTIMSKYELFAAATAISAIGSLTIPAPAQVDPCVPTDWRLSKHPKAPNGVGAVPARTPRPFGLACAVECGKKRQSCC
jgi:hypothetical protein